MARWRNGGRFIDWGALAARADPPGSWHWPEGGLAGLRSRSARESDGSLPRGCGLLAGGPWLALRKDQGRVPGQACTAGLVAAASTENRRLCNAVSNSDWVTRQWRPESFSEVLHPFDDPEARFDAATLPTNMADSLPLLTDRYEELYVETEAFVRAQPKVLPGDHYRALFGWLGERLKRNVWVSAAPRMHGDPSM